MNLVLVLVLLSSAGPAEGELDRLLARAVEAKARGDLEGALSAIRAARRTREHFKLRHNEARLLEELGRYREAAELYPTVIADPATPPDLAEDDRARLLALGPLLEVGHGRVQLSPKASLFVDDRPSAADFRHAPGAVWLEARSATVSALRSVELKAGLRGTFDLRLGAEQRPKHLVLSLGAEKRSGRLSVDQHPIRGALSGGLRELWLAPGPHAITLADEIQEEQRTLVGTAGERLELASLFPSAPPLSPESPQDSPPPAWSRTALGAGVLSVALGLAAGALYLSAGADRRTITAAEREGGLITGVTMREALALEEGAELKTTLGTTSLLGACVGGAAALVLVWVDAP